MALVILVCLLGILMVSPPSPPISPPTPLKTYTLTITNTTGGTTTPAPGSYQFAEGTVTNVTAIPEKDFNFSHWKLDGVNQGAPNPINVTMNANHTLLAVFKKMPLPKYYLTVISPYGTPGGEGWYDNCTTAYATLDIDIVDHGNGTRRVFTLWSGDASGTNYTRSDPIRMDQNKTAIANWKTQYLVTFSQSGVGTDFTGTVVTIDGTGYNVTNLPVFFWWDKNSQHNFFFSSPLVDSDKKYVWTSTSGLSTLQSETLTITSSGNVTANYAVQAKYQITFDQLGVDSDFTGTVVVIDGTNYSRTDLTVSFWWDAGSIHIFAFQSPLAVSPNGKRYLWISTAGLSTLQCGSITVSTSGSIFGRYKKQYCLTVTSLYGSPTPASGWFDAGTSITASVTSPVSGPTGSRYVCTGWIGTGSVPASGTTPSVTFTINAASSITWNWKTQYLLTVQTDRTGLSPQPTRSPAGEAGPGGWWYDSTTSVQLTAQPVTGYTFLNWDVDGGTVSGNPITMHMGMPHTATARYEKPPPPVGGYALPIVKSHFLAPKIDLTPGMGLAFVLLAAMAATIILIRRRNKRLKWEH